MNTGKTFVGFGLGAIQAGLFLLEAQASGAFERLVVAEVDGAAVKRLREAGGKFSVNVARPEGLETVEVGPVEVLDPTVTDDREMLLEALASADEIATAVPSVKAYVAGDPGTSIAGCLRAGLSRKAKKGGPRVVVYTAENHNDAAALLEAHVLEGLDEKQREALHEVARFVDTVIGKMSGVIGGEELTRRGLAPVTPGEERAFLVEAYNRILISRIDFDEPFERGLEIFEEKDDLRPFEEAKLYGHNAVHATGAYLGRLAGLESFPELRRAPGFLPCLRAALVEEAGAALQARHAGVDPRFSPEGFHAHALDLVDRMTEPHLGDLIERVARDPARKLGYEDRLVGSLWMVLEEGGDGDRLAMGVVAALEALAPGVIDSGEPLEPRLREVFEPRHREAPLPAGFFPALDRARASLRRWKQGGFGDLDLVVFQAR